MSDFIPGMREAFLYLSRQKGLRRWMETSSAARKLTSRFVAGNALPDAVRVAQDLARREMWSSLDYLGENVKTTAEACAAREAHLAGLHRIQELRLPATVSVKLTSLGLDISADLCRENADILVDTAKRSSSRVEFDMEDSRYTDRTLAMVFDLRQHHGDHVRAVIQACLYRSEVDIDELCRRHIPVRLCKGAYKEPSSVAWPDKGDVDRNYVKLMQTLFDKGNCPAIATHDESIIRQAITDLRQRKMTENDFEFQMLYGVRRRLQQEIVSMNFHVRIYVPYGTAWYPYFMRRLAERPANVLFVAKSVLQD